MSRTKGAIGRKHKKEKPVKEKKKRGRPSKQHQKQYQHQTVNVNVNGGGDESSRKPQIPAQIPSYIFDPSLIILIMILMTDSQLIHLQIQTLI